MGDEVARSEGRKIEPRTVVAIAVGFLVLLFIVQNRQQVGFDFLLFSFGIPLWFALGGTALLMFVIGFVFGRRSTRKG
jgi:uncharacterized integral membrane protein